MINQIDLNYLIIHIKLSSLFYSTQLVDMFAYDINLNLNKKLNFFKNINNSLIVYNFHSINFQQRFFIFAINKNNFNLKKNSNQNKSLNSITELFLNANWLEREISELHGIFFLNKKDLRNLMLQYGDTSAPMQKSFPSIGNRELYYDSSTDLLIQSKVSIQF